MEDSRRIDPILARPAGPGAQGPQRCGRPSLAQAGHAARVPPVDPGELAGLIAPYVTDGGPGHAVGVYRGGALVAHAAAGCAVIEHDIPIGAGTIFDIASASKQFTAACLLLLQRDGMLSLDEDRAQVPARAAAARPGHAAAVPVPHQRPAGVLLAVRAGGRAGGGHG